MKFIKDDIIKNKKVILRADLNVTIKEGKIIGTVASKNKNLIENPLNEYEIGELQTKSAITYKDKNLNLKHSEIILNRNLEIENSTLITLSQYKKLFFKKNII